MEWSNEKIIQFIKEIEKHPEIWDCNHEFYKNRNLKHHAAEEVARKFGCNSTEVHRKWKIILAQYRRERKKVVESKLGAGGISVTYKPKWFGYSHLRFYQREDEPSKSVHSEEIPELYNHYQQDVDNTNTSQHDTFGETDASYLEEECPTRESPVSSMNEYSLSSQQMPIATTIKRRYYPPVLPPPKRHMGQGPNIEANISRVQQYYEEDECSIFGKLVAKKLRKLEEDRKDLMMFKIHQLFHDESRECTRPNSSRNKQEDDIPQASTSYTDARMAGFSMSISPKQEWIEDNETMS